MKRISIGVGNGSRGRKVMTRVNGHVITVKSHGNRHYALNIIIMITVLTLMVMIIMVMIIKVIIMMMII